MKKFFKWIRSLWYGFFWGLKVADDTLTTSNPTIIPGTAITKEQEQPGVAINLLHGVVTQEVEELRYRTYLVDRESKEFEYIAPTLAFRREKNDSKFVTYENEDGLEIITIQPNEPIVENIAESLKYVGTHGKGCQYTIKAKRTFFPRYKLEEYTKRLVVKKLDDNHAILDFYVSKYPNDKDFKSKGFVREIEKIKNEKMKSDVYLIERVSFITNHAYKVVDLLEYEFDNLVYRDIVEYDGHYIVRFKSRITKNGYDLTEQYYSKTMDEKYKNKASKEVMLAFDDVCYVRNYICEHCGKEIIYDPEDMAYSPINKPREIDEEPINEEFSNTEYMDAEIAQQTFGIVLCKDCLKKFLAEHPDIEPNNL